MLRDGDDLAALLLESKTTPPGFPSGLVERTDLIDALRSGGSRLVTVTAPAGYGKTSLLADWQQGEERATGWLSFRAEDDDPAAVLRLLAHACTPFASEADSVFSRIATSEDSLLGRMAPTLALALSRCERPFVLFLDDVHVLEDDRCIDALEVALDRVPDGSQVVLASRHHPARLARRRLTASAAHVDASALRIDAGGAARIADEVGAHVSVDVLEEWVDRCDGWAAGIHMCALVSKSRPFASIGDHDILSDYLYQECLRDLPEDTREFLLRCSILTVHIPDLCDAVLGRSDSAHVLRDLEARQLFVTADHGRRSYRLHPLFREYLLGEFQLGSGASASDLHRRASQWFADRGQLPAAIDHAIAAAAFDDAVSLVTAAALKAYEAGESATLGRWLREIGDANLLASPSAVVVMTWFAVLAGGDDEAHKWSTLLSRVPPDADGAGIDVSSAQAQIRAIMMPDGIHSALADAAYAVDAEPLSSPWRDPAMQILGSTQLHAGEDERAVQTLAEALHLADAHGNPATVVICETEFALLAIESGDWVRAGEHADRALDTLRRTGIEGYVMGAYAHAAAACVDFHAGRRTAGEAHLAQAMAERQRAGRAVPLLSFPTRLLLVRAHLHLGNTDAARMLLGEVDDLLPRHSARGALDRRVATARRMLDERLQTLDLRAQTIALTTAEQRVLPYMQTHLTRAEIARRLFVSPNTVGTQMAAIYRKLGVSTRSDAVARALELDLLGSRQSSAAE
jgi:LuxR family maltose regulon positive regulatory protein